MSLKIFKDRGGHSIRVLEWDGYFLPFVLNGHVKRESLVEYMNDGDYSEDDIVLCSFPRSGTHWLIENVNMLVTKTLSLISHQMSDFNIEFKALGNCATTSGTQIHHTHLHPELLPKRLLNAKIIYIYRNPKDVAWSYYNLTRTFMDYNGTFQDHVECFLNGEETYGSWFEHTLKWEKFASEKNICVVTYENMSKKPIETVTRLADYLDIDVGQNFIKSVTKACHIDNMKNKTALLGGKVINTMVRKGLVGGWKEHFTVALSDKFDHVFAEKMKSSKLPFRFDKA